VYILQAPVTDPEVKPEPQSPPPPRSPIFREEETANVETKT
jgi:hypothetical protein